MTIDLNIIREFALLTTIALGGFLGLSVFFSNTKNRTNKFYLLASISIILWAIMGFLLGLPSVAQYGTYFGKGNYASVSLTLVSFYLLIKNFPNEHKGPYSILDYVFVCLGMVFAALSLFSGYIVRSISYPGLHPVWEMGGLYQSFNLFSLVVAIFIAARLFFKFGRSGAEDRKKISLLLGGIVLVAIFNTVFNILLPSMLSNDSYNWAGDYSIIFLLAAVAYAIVKHQMFNIKVITTEVTVIAISVALLIEAFISNNITEGVIKAAIWVLATYGGYILIKSVKTEIKQKENLEVLAKKLDEANRHLTDLDEQKDNFISMASHELNTPIAAIEGYLSMIIDEKMAGEINPKALKYLTNVYISSKRLASLVKDLLNVSRIESNRIHVIYTEAQIEDVIDQAVSEIAIKIKEVGHTLEWVRPKKLLPKTYLDMPRIIEVMINLLGNAIKYTDPPGKIKILAQADTEKIVVSVSDNGRGIPKDKYNHIFEKFSQVNVLKDQVKGTGLGMFISKNLIELHNGKLWFTSSVDPESHGTTFYFSLPILKTKPLDPHEGEGALFAVGKPKATTTSQVVVQPSTAESNVKTEPAKPTSPL